MLPWNYYSMNKQDLRWHRILNTLPERLKSHINYKYEGNYSILTALNHYGPILILFLIITTYVAVFGTLTWQQQSNFGTFGFDMGIYDQGIWLLSRFEEAFVTVRGLHLFGHHVNFFTILLVPFYWLGAGPHFLYIFETTMLALGAIPIWLITRHLTGNPWTSLTPSIAYLLFPSLGWINWWHFHPDALAIAPLLFAWYFVLVERWRLFTLSIILSLSMKEDVSIAVATMGILIALRAVIINQRSKYLSERTGAFSAGRAINTATVSNQAIYIGITTMAVGVIWWELCSKVILPYFNDYSGGAFYSQWFPGFGSTPIEVLLTIINNPSALIETITSSDHLTYYLKIFAPTGFLGLLSPVTLIAAPQLLVNSISAHGYTHNFQYHYTSIVLTGIFLGTAHAMAWIGNYFKFLKILLPVFLVIVAAYTHIQWSPSPLGKYFNSGVWAQPNARHKSLRDALELVPENANVTATYYIVPHLTHRKLIYEFPNPFRIVYWGLDGTNGGNPADIDYLLIDTRLLGSDKNLYTDLVSNDGPFEIILSHDNIELARRKTSQ